MDTRPRVVYWDDFPAPYDIERFNLLADRGAIDFTAWFLRPMAPDRQWDVDASQWRFKFDYVEDPSLGFGAMRAFARRCSAVRPDLLVSGYGMRPFVAGHAVVKALGIRTALIVGPSFDAWVRRRWWKEMLKALLFRSADAAEVEALAPAAREHVRPRCAGAAYGRRYGFPDDRMFAVTYSIDVSLYAQAADRDEVRRREVRTRIGAGDCLFLYVGRYWIAGKGIDVLLEAFRRARALNPRISLLLVGHGPDEETVRRAARKIDGVTVWGFLQPRDLLSAYGAADVFVFPTRGDPFGLVAEEAHAAALPIITSDAAGDIHLRVRDGESGFVVPSGDVAAFADRMLRLAADPVLRAAMGARGAARVRDWGHDRFAADFERFVDGALAVPRRATVSGRLMRAAGLALLKAAGA